MAKADRRRTFARLVPKLPELKLPKFDLDALFAVQTANLAAAHEAQTVLVECRPGGRQGAVRLCRAGGRRCQGGARPPRSCPSPRPCWPTSRPAEKAIAVAKEVVDLTVGAQKRVGRAGDPAHPGHRRRVQGARRLTPVSARCGGGPGIAGPAALRYLLVRCRARRVPFCFVGAPVILGPEHVRSGPFCFAGHVPISYEHSTARRSRRAAAARLGGPASG